MVEQRHMQGPTAMPLPAGEAALLGSAPASRRDRRLAWAVASLLFAAFVLTAPAASWPLPAVPAFVPTYDAAVIVLDLITAVLLYAQYRELREQSLLALTCGYAFTPLVVAAHGISFPEAFGPGSLIGGSQTTAWLWMVWHGLFPCFVGAYAWLARRERQHGTVRLQSSARLAPLYTLIGTLALAAGMILLATAGEPLLPELMLGNNYRSPATRLILSVAWGAHLAAFGLLIWSTRGRRVIDLWLAVTLLAAVIDLALSAILIDGRYQLGFYAGRFYGLLASSFVLAVLLRQAVGLHGGLVCATAALRASEAQYRSLFNSMDEGYILVDVMFDENDAPVDILYLEANPAAVRMTGTELVGRRTREIAPDTEPHWFETFGRVAKTGTAERHEYQFAPRQAWYDFYVFKVGNGYSRRVAAVYQDVTERKRAEEALQRAHDELEVRVDERTAELATAYQALQLEVAERKLLETQRASLVERIITAQEGERQSIARELHDTLGQFLSALNLRLSMVQSLEGILPAVSGELARLRALTSRIEREVDRLTMELRPPALQDLGLADAVGRYAEEWTTTSGVPVGVLVTGLDDTRLAPAIETTAYRIVQEALTNVLKHAQATSVSVIVDRRPGVLRVIVEDDGVGFKGSLGSSQGAGGRQVGLIGMAERATLAGGELTIESAPGAGTSVYLHIPLGEDTPAATGGAHE